MQRAKRWKIVEADSRAAELADRLRGSPLLAQILLNRGLGEFEACRAFLQPSLNMLHKPATLAGLTRAAGRVAEAIKSRQKIVIYGDYDADGITATAILWHAIRLLGGVVDYYIPHRIDEGYGLNPEAIAQLCDNGAQLIITVDCGITAIEEARIARDRGVDLIVTDHHEWRVAGSGQRAAGSGEGVGGGQWVVGSGEEAGSGQRAAGSGEGVGSGQWAVGSGEGEVGSRKSEVGSEEGAGSGQRAAGSEGGGVVSGEGEADLPCAYAIVHPRLREGGEAYGNPSLCGAGVAFKLAWGVGQAMHGERVKAEFREYLVDATALAALGTVADVVPLTGENRVLAHEGLRGLKASRLTGIRALIASAGLTGQKLDSYHIGFRLAPRLNACGRMGHARMAVELLTTAGPARAQEIADLLEQQNRIRQETGRKIFEQAVAQVEELGMDNPDCRGFVLGAEGWHPGVVGITASKIVERYGRPTVLIGLNEGMGQGSARSIAGFDLAAALNVCTGHLLSHGGHEMAAGCKLEASKFEAFRTAFAEYAGRMLSPEMLNAELEIEAVAELRQITPALVAELKRMEPFGQGNRSPLLACLGVEVAGPARRVGKTGDTLQLQVKQGSTRMNCVAFNFGHLCDDLRPGRKVDLAVEAGLNEYNGRTSVQLEVKDVRFGES